MPRFPLLFAGAFFFLWTMEKERTLYPIANFVPIIYLIPAGILLIVGIGDLFVTLLYRLFRVEERIEQEAGRPHQTAEQIHPEQQHAPLFSDKWNRLIK